MSPPDKLTPTLVLLSRDHFSYVTVSVWQKEESYKRGLQMSEMKMFDSASIQDLCLAKVKVEELRKELVSSYV